MRGLFLFSALFVCSLYAADINDPFEDINRGIFNFNESVDKNFLKPVAKVYSKTPKPIPIKPKIIATPPKEKATG